MIVTCDSVQFDNVREVRTDGGIGAIVPRTKFLLGGRQVAEYVSYNVARIMRKYDTLLRADKCETPLRFDIRVVRVDDGRMVYTVLPE